MMINCFDKQTQRMAARDSRGFYAALQQSTPPKIVPRMALSPQLVYYKFSARNQTLSGELTDKIRWIIKSFIQF